MSPGQTPLSLCGEMLMKRTLMYFASMGSLLLLSMDVSAEAGWTDYVQVAELTPTTHQRYLVKLNVSENPSGCKNKVMFYQDYSAPGSEHAFRLLLEAVTSGKHVRVYVTGRCEINGYAEITSISIVP